MHGTTYDMYLNYVSLSEEAPISKSEFPLLANQAWQKLLQGTYGRVGQAKYMNEYRECIQNTICALIVTINGNQQIQHISSERVGEHSVTYRENVSDSLIQSALSNIDYCNGKPTNLRYRGNLCKGGRIT